LLARPFRARAMAAGHSHDRLPLRLSAGLRAKPQTRARHLCECVRRAISPRSHRERRGLSGQLSVDLQTGLRARHKRKAADLHECLRRQKRKRADHSQYALPAAVILIEISARGTSFRIGALTRSPIAPATTPMHTFQAMLIAFEACRLAS